jgi:MarR family 2-MHQ and catechol resistance regulon transcriptional repressor
MEETKHVEERLNLKLMVVLSKLVKAVDQRFAPEMKEAGLTPTQFTVLEALYHKGPLSVNQIIEKAISSSGNIGVVIDNLMKCGLVEKHISEQDKRSKNVFITEKGRSVIGEFFPKHVESINSSFTALNSAEKETLTELMKKLGKSIGANL